jgi:DNA helicase-2/ATP-dependent DNA helicase PcrA
VPSLDDLNRPQREAVTTLDGPLLVLAGAGSGKTRVITYRVSHLLERGARPEQILAVSFTNKAAEEMRERVGKLVGPRGGRGLTLCTFHALGLQVLRAERAALGFHSGFTIYDSSDQLGCVREILRDVKIDDRRFDPKAILFRISRAKNAFVGPDQLPDSEHDYDQVTRLVYPRYQKALAAYHALDFDDLIVETVRLLDRDPEVRARWQERFRWLMVDEYQDTNRTQFLLVRHLAARHGNLCVVGDDDQSIYGWRGAEAGHILEFERHFPGARRVVLEENYRSTPPILEAANAVIAHNGRRHAKRLFTTRPGGDKLQLVVAPDAEAEARFIAEEVDLLRERRGYKAGDCAVLYRSNIQSRPFEEALRTQRLPYRMIGGQGFFERKEVKDAIAYLRVALAPRDEIALRRIVNYPARGIGETTVERCAVRARERKLPLSQVLEHVGLVEEVQPRARQSVEEFVQLIARHRPQLAAGRNLGQAARALIEEAGLPEDLRAGAPTPNAAQRRLDNLEGLYRGLDAWEQRSADTSAGKLANYLQMLTLASAPDEESGDDGEPGGDRVTLCTLHGAKGLEFPVVFLVGLEEELLPHKRTLYPHGPDVAEATIDLSEERRLLYVGITRAREILYLTRCRARAARSAQKERSPSRFLEEIPAALCEQRDLELPRTGDAADEAAFARACLDKLFKLTDAAPK